MPNAVLYDVERPRIVLARRKNPRCTHAVQSDNNLWPATGRATGALDRSPPLDSPSSSSPRLFFKDGISVAARARLSRAQLVIPLSSREWKKRKAGQGRETYAGNETENEDAARAISRVRLLTRRYSRVGIPFPPPPPLPPRVA